ncbi:uncharacterized protein LOC144469004 [Augochlora pura]
MKTSLTCSILFCLVVLIKSTTPLGIASVHNRLHYFMVAAGPSIDQATENLKRILNFINESPEFRPLTLSVVLPRFHSSFVDSLVEHVNESSMKAFKVRSQDLSLAVTLLNRSQLTWIIFARDLYNLYSYIYWQPGLWKTSNQYLIIIPNRKVSLDWRGFLRKLWTKHRVYKTVIVSLHDNFRCLVGFKPFQINGEKFGDIRKLCFQSVAAKGSEEVFDVTSNDPEEDRATMLKPIEPREEILNQNTHLFEIFHNLNNYPINIIVFESLLSGFNYDDQHRLKLSRVDGDVVYALENALRCKFRVTFMRKVDFYMNDPFDKSLNEIENGNVEMVITGFFVKQYTKRTQFQFTPSMYEDKLCFLSPDSGLVPKAYMPFMPFEKDLWAVLLIYNVIVTLLWCFFKGVSPMYRPTDVTGQVRTSYPCDKSGRHMDKVTNGLAMTLKSRRGPPEVPEPMLKFFKFVELLCYPFPKEETSAQRSLLAGTLFFGLIVNGVYQSGLVSSLSKPFHYPQLRTLEDVIDSGKILITKYANLKTVFLDDTPVGMKLEQRINVITTRKQTKALVAFDDKIAITRYYSMLLGDYAYYDKDGNPLIYVVDECPMNYRVSYVLRSPSPYAERVNFVLLRLNEAGIPAISLQKTLFKLTIVKMRRKLNNEKRKIILTLHHYSLTFLLLFVGLVCSGVIFFVEIYMAGRARSG